MSTVNIRSENQSGGITAQNVNLASRDGGPQEVTKQGKRWSAKAWTVIVGIATLVAAIVAVLTYFGLNHR